MRQARLVIVTLFLLPVLGMGLSNGHDNQNDLLLALSLIIGGASLSWCVQKVGLPAVTGELALGMVFATFTHFHCPFWQHLLTSPVIAFLAEVGSILLLFEIGLESSVSSLFKVGRHGLLTAIIGVFVPFLLGYWFLGRWLFATNDSEFNLFLGATLAATSTGISVRVFKDLGIIRNAACQIVLAASVIDDIMGLVILAFVSGLVISGSSSFMAIGVLLLKVTIFFILVLIFARKWTPYIIQQAFRIRNDEAMLVAILLSFCMFWAWIASLFGLASIIGAFVAGLIIDEVNFRNSQHPYWYNQIAGFQDNGSENYQQLRSEIVSHYHEERLSNLIKPLNHVFVPIFFVYAGMQVDVMAIADWKIILYGVVISIVAIAGKVISGIFLPSSINRWLVGFGMVPRGEIGLIFALTGRQLGVFNQEVFATVLIMIVITSLVTPLALQQIVRHRARHENTV